MKPVVFASALAMATFSLTPAAASSATTAVSSPVSCGDIVTADTVLHEDLVDCPDNGLVIGADGVRIDLNGHRLSGDNALNQECGQNDVCDVGIDNSRGYGDLVIEDGSIRDFGVGILVVGASDNRLIDLRVSDHIFSGVVLVEASQTLILENTVTANGLTTDQAGITVIASQETRIVEAVVTANGDIGLFAAGMDDSRIADSVFADNFEAGIILEGSGNRVVDNHLRRNGDGLVLVGDGNVIRGNHVTDTLGCDGECGFAISFEGGSDNLGQGNTIARTLTGIRLDAFAGPAADTGLRGNVVRRATNDGIVVDLEQVGPVTGTVLERNLVTRSGDDGIDVNAADTTLLRNEANRNADLGIEAVDGVTDGGGNRAFGNGNPLQCTGVSC